ncbi:MAG: hypothetical protein IPG56_20605 [Caulobacteraceae bacterium]|nr:hypothetical protein [Caulobacteraceae bacterium]
MPTASVVGHDGSKNTGNQHHNSALIRRLATVSYCLKRAMPGLATDIAGEWVFWNTGTADPLYCFADTQRVSHPRRGLDCYFHRRDRAQRSCSL